MEKKLSYVPLLFTLMSKAVTNSNIYKRHTAKAERRAYLSKFINSLHYHGEMFLKSSKPNKVTYMNDKWPKMPPVALDQRELRTVANIMKYYYDKMDEYWLDSLKFNYKLTTTGRTCRKHPIIKKVKIYWNRKKLCIFIFR